MHVRGLQTGHCAPSAPLHAQQPSARLRQTHHRHAAARSASQSGGAAGASPPNVDVVGTAADTQATGTSPAASTSGRDVQYSYHSDGHYKATIEDVFGSGGGQAPLGAGKAPWRMGWQTNERNIMWNEDLKMRLLTKVAAREGDVSEERLRAQISDLLDLLPAIQPRLASMKPELLLRLAAATPAVARKLLELKAIFPDADCGKMLVKELGLMGESEASLRRRAARLRAFLPALNVDIVVETHPSVLSVEKFEAAVADARRLIPGVSIEGLLLTDPDFVLSLQKGTDMIPYDAVPENKHGHR